MTTNRTLDVSSSDDEVIGLAVGQATESETSVDELLGTERDRVVIKGDSRSDLLSLDKIAIDGCTTIISRSIPIDGDLIGISRCHAEIQGNRWASWVNSTAFGGGNSAFTNLIAASNASTDVLTINNVEVLLKSAKRNSASSAGDVELISDSAVDVGVALLAPSSGVSVSFLSFDAATNINTLVPLDLNSAARDAPAASSWLIPPDIDSLIIGVKGCRNVSGCVGNGTRVDLDSVREARGATTVGCGDSKVVLNSITEAIKTASSVVELVSGVNITTCHSVRKIVALSSTKGPVFTGEGGERRVAIGESVIPTKGQSSTASINLNWVDRCIRNGWQKWHNSTTTL